MSTPSAKQLFLFILDQGGWWTVKELAEMFGLEGYQNSTRLLAQLRQLSDAGSLVKRNLTLRHVEFGVTPACRVPRGITLEELQP